MTGEFAIAVIALVGTVASSLVALYAAGRAKRASEDLALLKARLDLGLAKQMQVTKEQIDVLVEVSARVSHAQRRAKGVAFQLVPPLHDMPEARFEEFLETTQLSPTEKGALRSSAERTGLYASYVSRKALNDAWLASYVARDLIDAKACLLDEPVLVALRSHVDLLFGALSGYEEDRMGLESGQYKKEWRETLQRLDPGYRELERALRQALYDEPSSGR